MRIEINAGGLGGGIAIAQYQLNMAGFINQQEDVIDAFKAVRSSTYNLNGGVGNLGGAVDALSQRISEEEQNKESANEIRRKSNAFLDLAIRVDKQVAVDVKKNREEFYKVNPWLRPPVPQETKFWHGKSWEWLRSGPISLLKDGATSVAEIMKDTIKKAWDGLVEFYNEHKKVIDTILVVVGVVATIAAVIASGGTALAGMTALFTTIGFSASTAATISAAIAITSIVSTSLSGVLNIADIWLEIDNPVFNTVQTTVGVISTVSTVTYTVGSAISKNIKVDVDLQFKDNWTAEQKRQALEKCDALTKANTKKVSVNRNGTSASYKYKSVFGKNSVPANYDVDHIIDLQLNGIDDVLNMKPIHKSVNRSLGTQIQHAIEFFPKNQKFGIFSIS